MIADSVTTLTNVILGGDDVERSLVTRLTRLEDSVKNCQKSASERQKGEARKSSNAVSVVCALISSIAAILVALIALLD